MTSVFARASLPGAATGPARHAAEQPKVCLGEPVVLQHGPAQEAVPPTQVMAAQRKGDCLNLGHFRLEQWLQCATFPSGASQKLRVQQGSYEAGCMSSL